MLPLFEHLQEVVALKRFLDEFAKHPGRTILAVAAVFLISVGVAKAGIKKFIDEDSNKESGREITPKQDLTQLSSEHAQLDSDGAVQNLPYPHEAEAALKNTLSENVVKQQAVDQQMASRPANAPPSTEEIRLLNESGQVDY